MDYKKERQRIREIERILHFCGYSLFDEVSSEEKSLLADEFLLRISKSPEVSESFELYKPAEVILPLTFESRISGLLAVIANYLAGNSIFRRNLVADIPEFQKSQLFRHDPYFGEYVDALIGEPTPPELILETGLDGKDTIKIADFACAPKKDGGSSILFLKLVLPKLFPEKQFEFFGYDIDFQDRYPKFDEEGNFKGWQEGYVFDREGIAHHDGSTYYNAAQNPQFNLVPQRRGHRFVNTFDTSHNKYDIIVNSMFYSMLEMNGEPDESLDIMRNNLLRLRTPQGVVFLNTCDDCFRIFPAPTNDALPAVIPFISTIANIEQKVREMLTGGKYCKGAYNSDYEPAQEERKRVEMSIYNAHRLATRDLTFLDRLFEVYERINEGSNLEQGLSCLINPHLIIDQERKRQTKNRIYSIKQNINRGRK